MGKRKMLRVGKDQDFVESDQPIKFQTRKVTPTPVKNKPKPEVAVKPEKEEVITPRYEKVYKPSPEPIRSIIVESFDFTPEAEEPVYTPPERLRPSLSDLSIVVVNKKKKPPVIKKPSKLEKSLKESLKDNEKKIIIVVASVIGLLLLIGIIFLVIYFATLGII